MMREEARKSLENLVACEPELAKYLRDFSEEKFRSIVEKYPEEIKRLRDSDEAREVAEIVVGGPQNVQASAVGAAIFVGAEVYVG